MPASNDQITNLDAELDALSSPTTAQTYVVSKDYDPDVVAASAARRALAGGGGGGLPEWQQSGAGSPVETVTPEQAGAVYFDTTNGGLYLAIGATDTDWVVVGGAPGNVGEATGLVWVGANRDIYMLAGERDTFSTAIFIGSAYSQWNGQSQGIVFSYGTDSLRVSIRTGATGQFLGYIQDNEGNVVPAHTIDATNMPTSNPGPNLLWNDAGTVKVGT